MGGMWVISEDKAKSKNKVEFSENEC